MVMLVVLALSACSLSQAAVPTATPVDINAVMTSAAATAFVQLTQIAGQASATLVPTKTPTAVPPTNTQPSPAGTGTQEPALQLLTSTPSDGAAGLPVVSTSLVSTPVVAGTPTLTLSPGVMGGSPTLTKVPGLTPIGSGQSNVTVITCLNSKFVADITIPDYTVLKPYEKFTKIWRIQNTGTCSWDQGFGLVMWAGEAMSGEPVYFSRNDKPVDPGGIVDMVIEMRAPTKPGEYIAHWVMVSDTGQTFGGDLTVAIKVSD